MMRRNALSTNDNSILIVSCVLGMERTLSRSYLTIMNNLGYDLLHKMLKYIHIELAPN